MMREVSPLSEVMELLVKLEFAVERKDGRMNRGTGVLQQLLWGGVLVLTALCCAGGTGRRLVARQIIISVVAVRVGIKDH